MSRSARWAGLVGSAVLATLPVVTAQPAAAHPLDAYLQSTYLTIGPSSVLVEMDLSPGVLIAPRALEQLDADHDREVSEAEARTYLTTQLRTVELRADDQVLDLALTRVEVPSYLAIQAGYGTLRVFASAARAVTPTGEHTVFFRNGSTDPKAAFQVNAFVAEGAAIALGRQDRDPSQRQATVHYRVGAGVSASAAASAVAGVGTGGAAASATAASVAGSGLAGYLEAGSLPWWTVLVAFGAAAVLGALHALTPGHAKTLIAAYLVGNGGTLGNAALLGAVVTFTHTASVVLIGLIALLASRFLLPSVLVPGLELVSGLIVLTLGLRLLRQRWPRRRRESGPVDVRQPLLTGAPAATARTDQVHGHEHGPGHGHAHAPGGREHTHELPSGQVSVGSLVALGVSGGLVPCPEALGVMILAVGLNRTVLGLGLIVSFSLGLAAVLIGLGLLLVRSRALISRFAAVGPGWATALPLASAAVVTVLGLGLVAKAAALV